ncbi:MAG: IS21 family transposase [Deltaproteobacteria bacterium]|nr:IS21 family transposase [Deltaproteobacteria bacterium]
MEEWHAIQVLKRQGHGKKAIARQLGISKNTVKRHWNKQTPPTYQRTASEKMLDPFATQIQEMVAKHFIGTRIFQELTDLGYTGSLTSVYRYLRQFQDDERNRTTIHFETSPGQQMQYDWKEWQVSVAGRPLKIYFHQAILSYSRYKYVTFSLDISTPSIIRVLTQALVFFQGVPAEIVIDNPKQLVLSHDRQGVIRYQDDFLAFLGTHGLKPDPCQPYRARTKGKVENPFFYLQEHFLRGLEVEDLNQLEERLARFMEQYNARIHSTTGQPPVQLWPQENLRPLQDDISLSFQKESRKTSWDGYVHVDSNRYPVPLALAGKKVWIERVLGRWLDILDADLKPLARYELLRQHQVTLPHPEHADLAKEFLDRKEQRRVQVKVAFQETFPALAPDFIRLAEQSYTLNASYHLNKILDLLSVYDHQAVATALHTALELGTPSVRSVQALLPEKLQQPVLPTSCRTACLPAVAQRPLSLYRASYGGGAR